MQILEKSFQKYIKKEVLELVELDNMGLKTLFDLDSNGRLNLEIFYVGLPPKKFPDFDKLARHILGGDLLHETAKTDPPIDFTEQDGADTDPQEINEAQDETSTIQTGIENMWRTHAHFFK